MIISGPEKQWANIPDPKLRNYCCIEYAMMGAYWLCHVIGKKPAIVTLYSIRTLPKEYWWSHSVCEVPNLGTYDFHHNIFFPDYYYHQGPVTDEQVEKSTQACAWTTHRDYNCIDIYYKYHPQEVRALEMSQVVLRQTKYFNGC